GRFVTSEYALCRINDLKTCHFILVAQCQLLAGHVYSEYKNPGVAGLELFSSQPLGGSIPLLPEPSQRRGGCATKKMSRPLRNGADGGRSPRKPARSVSAIARNIKK